MKFELVETITKQNIKLSGCLISENNKKCILYIPGLAGNFFETSFTKNISKECLKLGYDFLFSHNQGSYQVIEVPYLREDGKWKSKLRGAAYEKFEDSAFDIDGWVNYLEKNNYKEIVIIAHSMGCNKIVYYLNQFNNKLIKDIILLAPQDNVNFDKLDMHKGLLKESIKNIEKGLNDKLLSKKFLGFCLMSSETYYQEITNKNINNIPYKTKNGDFTLYKNINKPLYIIIGSLDIGEDGDKYMGVILNNSKNTTYKILEDANHNFKNKEIELTELIIDYLK